MSPSKKEEQADQTVITHVEKIQGDVEKKAYILFLSGPLVGKICLLEEGDTTIGRAPEATIPINDVRISRQHVQIQVVANKTMIRDLGSTNGSYVNGKKITEQELLDGDKVQLSSSTIFKFAYQDNIENVFHKELYKMAVLDAVTGIYNKRFFLDRLKEELSHARRAKLPLSLLMIDVDHFKNINDTHGHLAGDFVLAHLAQTIKSMVRGEDVAARYGGEEFAVILRGSDGAGAFPLAERIRKTAMETPCDFEEKKISLTISIGIASLQDENFATPEAIIAAADQALYQSKEKGRNRTSKV